MTSSDAIVVGAGLSGLVAARELTRAGLAVTVLEARDRVGGRTLSTTHDGQIVDLGGQWIGDKHDRLRALMSELGIAAFPQYSTGKKIVERSDGKRKTFSGLMPKIGLFGLLDLGLALKRLEKLAKTVPVDNPLAAPDANELDSITLADWMERRIRTRPARDMVALAAQMIFAAEPREISFLYFLLYANANEGLQRLASIEHGAQEQRFVTGAQSISQRLAEQLVTPVRLDHPVRAIEQDASTVTVHTVKGSFRARRAILALPPAMLRKIDIAPELAATRALLHERMHMGSAIKCIVSYDKPFWREAGYSGEAFSTRGVVRATFDDCSPSADRAALVAFVVGDPAKELSRIAMAERRRIVLAELGRLHGPAAHRATDYVDKDWSTDDWSGGCYVGLMAPTILTQTAATLRAPHGLVHFAGTETATHHVGYLEGAIEAGRRAAAEVIAQVRVAVDARAG